MRSLATFPLNSLWSTSRKEASDRFQLDFFVSSAAGSYSLVLMGAKSNDISISFGSFLRLQDLPPVYLWGYPGPGPGFFFI